MIGLLIYTIIEAPNHGWASARTLGSFALTAVLAAAFVAWERRTDEPMLDLSLFGNPRFTAASASVAISFFALSGFIFLVTQYFQFLKGYGPLSTGVRLLPVASFVAISSILGAKLAVRVGTKLVVASGLFSMAAFYLWVTTATATTSYGTIAAQMVVLGTGMGLTSAPATEAIMGVVPKAKAGVGSAVNDATRLLGGTLGVAVIGSVYASLYASRLTSALPARTTGHRRTDRARIGRRRAHRRGQAGPCRPSGARGGDPQRRQLGLLPRLPHRQLPRRRRRRRRRPDGARVAARPPDGQQPGHARDTSSSDRPAAGRSGQLTHPRRPGDNHHEQSPTHTRPTAAGSGVGGRPDSSWRDPAGRRANIDSALERNRVFAAAGGHQGAVVFPTCACS